jgi:hypothetical protein
VYKLLHVSQRLYTLRVMFVRWQSRSRRHSEYGDDWHTADIHWRAILVEAVRVDGKPTQRHIAYLGGVTESALAIPFQQRYFWENVEWVLDRLKLKPEERRKIVTAVAKKVGPPPTPRQRKQLDREIAAIRGDLKG